MIWHLVKKDTVPQHYGSPIVLERRPEFFSQILVSGSINRKGLSRKGWRKGCNQSTWFQLKVLKELSKIHVYFCYCRDQKICLWLDLPTSIWHITGS